MLAFESVYLTNFSDLGLAEPILRAVAAQGYTTPTPIQSQVIPVMMSGKDILGIAQTGTGKTASFTLPLLNRLIDRKGRPAPSSCGALILAPTRELVAQIADNIRAYSQFMKVSITVIVGGVKPGPQIRKLASGSDIIVATPGRLLDHLNNGVVKLDQAHTVVLDEADHMLDLGFIPDIRRIMKHLPKKRQTALLSATMPAQIRSLARDFQTNPEEISVTPASRPIERITQSVRHTSRDEKRHLLTRILSDKGVERAIVFTRTKRGADRVSQHLQKAGLAATAIHGNKSQNARIKALDSFRKGETTIMVATDIAARGIDIDDVSHVVNFELPEVPESYVHRIGRTARAGRSGIAISLCDPSESKLLRDIERLIGNRLDNGGVESYSPLDASVPDTPLKAEPNGSGRNRKPRRNRGASASGHGRSGEAGGERKARSNDRTDRGNEGAVRNGKSANGFKPKRNKGQNAGAKSGNGSSARLVGHNHVASTQPVHRRGGGRNAGASMQA